MSEKTIEENIYIDGSLALNEQEDIMKEEIKIKPKRVYRFIKRIIDIVVGLIGVIILAPITVVLYIVNIFADESKGPLFYDQLRVGKNGKYFKIYKFRTMIVGADKILEKYLEENEEARIEYKKYKKLKNDPRVTKVGEFIRKTSLDEFPQFINVLKGDMSLVGPRPYLPREKEDMGDYYDCIIQARPGVTGYWQIAGRSDVTFDDRLKMDYNYIQNKNLKTDLKLLGKTVLNVVKKEGAI